MSIRPHRTPAMTTTGSCQPYLAPSKSLSFAHLSSAQPKPGFSATGPRPRPARARSPRPGANGHTSPPLRTPKAPAPSPYGEPWPTRTPARPAPYTQGTRPAGRPRRPRRPLARRSTADGGLGQALTRSAGGEAGRTRTPRAVRTAPTGPGTPARGGLAEPRPHAPALPRGPGPARPDRRVVRPSRGPTVAWSGSTVPWSGPAVTWSGRAAAGGRTRHVRCWSRAWQTVRTPGTVGAYPVARPRIRRRSRLPSAYETARSGPLGLVAVGGRPGARNDQPGSAARPRAHPPLLPQPRRPTAPRRKPEQTDHHPPESPPTDRTRPSPSRPPRQLRPRRGPGPGADADRPISTAHDARRPATGNRSIGLASPRPRARAAPARQGVGPGPPQPADQRPCVAGAAGSSPNSAARTPAWKRESAPSRDIISAT